MPPILGRDELPPRRSTVPGAPTAPWGLPPDDGRARDARGDDEDGPEEEEPKLHRSRRVVVFCGTFAVWALAMLVLGVHWWDFERHGPWLTPLTPLVLGGAVEGALLRRWPEWARDHDPATHVRRARGAEALGDRARPYWARDASDGAPLEGHAPDGVPDPDDHGTPAPEPGPDDVSARTRRSP